MPPGQVRYLKAYGSPSTPAPTIAVVLWKQLCSLQPIQSPVR